MNRDRESILKTEAIAEWKALLQNEGSLLGSPGVHHRALLKQAHALHQSQVINHADLSDLLELADGALAYAMELLLDGDNNEHSGAS